MQNKLKPVTTEIIHELNHANIRTIMATGDNVLTAISVGRECKIIDPLSEVFLGDVRKIGGRDQIQWRSTTNVTRTLNRKTLTPEDIDLKQKKNRLSHV